MANEPDNSQDFDGDEQDQSEAFDEDNFDAADPGFDTADMKTMDEQPDVLDVTARAGDEDDDDAAIGEELDDDEIIELEAQYEDADIEDDPLKSREPEAFDDDSLGPEDAEEVYHLEEAKLDVREETPGESGGPAEVRLVDSGDLLNASNAAPREEASFESRNLSDEDLEDLDYATLDKNGEAHARR